MWEMFVQLEWGLRCIRKKKDTRKGFEFLGNHYASQAYSIVMFNRGSYLIIYQPLVFNNG